MVEIGADTPRDVVLAIARGAGPVRLDGPARERIAAAAAAAARVAQARPVYGRSTAVGANLVVARSTDPAAVVAADRALLASHAATAGPPLTTAEVRAGIAVRLCQLAQGNSGISVSGAQALATLLDGRPLPPIGRFHAVGTGDLGAFATLAGALDPGAFAAGDALPLLSSGALTVGRAVLAVADVAHWLELAERVAVTTMLATRGAVDAWRPEAVGPDPGARRVAARLTAGLAGREPVAARLQDPFGLRTAPQTLGVLDDAVSRLQSTVDALLHSGPENPRVIADPPQVLHNGAFHAVRLAADLDAATAALARAAAGSGQRLSMLMAPGGPTGSGSDPPFLADKPGDSGLMALEYVAASALADVRAAAFPVAVQQVHVGNQVETDAGFAPQAVTQLNRGVDAAFVVLAAELVAAWRGLRRGSPMAPVLGPAWLTLPDDPTDHDLTGDLAAALLLIRPA